MKEVKEWPQAVVEISRVRPWDKNPRTIKKSDLERLKQQILQLGLYKPLLVTPDGNGGFITLGGNMRLQALKEIGASRVRVTIVDAPTDADKIKFSLSDNDRVGTWDEDALAELIIDTEREFDNIKDLGIFKLDLNPKATRADVLFDYFKPAYEGTDEDVLPKTSPEPITRPGQLFKLGPHRLVCGDSTEDWAVQAALDGKHADMVFTDPPYNVAYKSENASFDIIKNDNLSQQAFFDFVERSLGQIKKALKPGGVIYLCSGYSSYPVFLYAIKKAGFVFSHTLVWVKNDRTNIWGDYKGKYENLLVARKSKKKTAETIIYGWKEGPHFFQDEKIEVDVWEITRRGSSNLLHPTQKPVALVERAIRNSSRAGELIFDPFAGSGTTLIAAERLNRRAALIELDPVFCDVIIKRYAAQGLQTEEEIRATAEQIWEPDLAGPKARAEGPQPGGRPRSGAEQKEKRQARPGRRGQKAESPAAG